MSGRLLEGKVALVTGAGRGLGRGFAEHLAALGCSVGVHGMRKMAPQNTAKAPRSPRQHSTSPPLTELAPAGCWVT